MSLALHQIRQEKANRLQQDGLASRALKGLTPHQLAFINSPHRFKVLRCGRRGGKSTSILAYMIYECLKAPSMPCLFLALTNDQAKDIAWPELLKILDTNAIPYRPVESRGRINFPNNSFIQLMGADAPKALDRLRGKRFKLVACDEFGFSVNELAKFFDALLPTLADYYGTLVLSSSPPPVANGIFYDADIGKDKDNWDHFTWTLQDNPWFQGPPIDTSVQPHLSRAYLTRAEEELWTVCKTKFGGNWSHPGFKREYFGEWVFDTTSLVYPIEEKRDLLPVTPKMMSPRYGIGIDLGVASCTSFAVMQYSEYSREVCFVHAFKRAEMTIDEVVTYLKGLIKEYDPDVIVADAGGLGAVHVQEMRKLYGLPILAAKKTQKTVNQRIMANDMLSGYVKVLPNCGELLREWKTVVRDELGDEEKGQENHLSDAALYVFRQIHTTYLQSFEAPKSEEDIMLETIEKQYRMNDEASSYDF